MTFDLIGGPGYMAERITRDEVRALLAAERAAILAIVRAERAQHEPNILDPDSVEGVRREVRCVLDSIIAAIEARHG